jgi:hypothetical protein
MTHILLMVFLIYELRCGYWLVWSYRNMDHWSRCAHDDLVLSYRHLWRPFQIPDSKLVVKEVSGMIPHQLIHLALGIDLGFGLLVCIAGHLQGEQLLVTAQVIHLILFIFLLVDGHLLHLLLLREYHLILGH